MSWKNLEKTALLAEADMVVMTNISPVHAPRRAEALRRVLGGTGVPIVDLFSRQDRLLHGAPPPQTLVGQ